MERWWTDRAFTQEEAADLAGLRYAGLRDWLGKTGAGDLVSERRGSKRWFSARDILALRIAHQLTLGGMVVLTAMAAAFAAVQDIEPDDGSILVVPNGAVAHTQVRRATADDLTQFAAGEFDGGIQLIPAGRIALLTFAATEAAYRKGA